MNTNVRFCRRSGCAVLASVVVWASAMVVSADLPVIESIQVEGTNVVVNANVPPGIARVVLESRAQLQSGAWVPVAVQDVDGSGGAVQFRLPREGQLALLRVRADADLPLPAAFYTGTNAFDVQPASGTAAWLAPTVLDGTTSGGSPEAREVVESDIWRIDGDTLYFFNQYRGLQIIDIADPDHAALLGTLNLPAAGEQMYLLSHDRVALLVQSTCYSIYGSSQSTEILIVAVSDGAPEIVARLPVNGTITESRMVGTALYVASQFSRPMSGTDGSTWEWGTQITSFDLADPARPVLRTKLWYAGYNNVVQSTDIYFFAVTQDPTNWQQSVVNAIDITDPDGTMHAHHSFRVTGRVADKFKLDWTDWNLSVISEVSTNPRLTKLETFRLPDPRSLSPESPHKLGEVEVGHGEQLYATRFDYPRVYIVTFLRIDPLWIVDLSDPSKPTVSGELQIPGWSTYIHPLGDRLVTVGVESNRTTVSLFDVQDPEAPAMLSRVHLGSRYSYSEANQDEKAFNVLEDTGLILLPVQSFETNGYRSWVQLIDLDADSLTARGSIEHDFAPRRATLHRDRIVSISGSEFLSVDATDRDHPIVTRQLDLAWPVNRVFLAGEYLIQITTGNGWYSQDKATVRVTPATDPSEVLTTLSLTNVPIAGATVRSNRLYLAQAENGYIVPMIYGGPTNVPPTNTLWLSVVDASNLPDLAVLGRTSVHTTPLGYYSELEPLWPRPDVLVWAGGANSGWWWPWDTLALGAPVADVAFAPYPLGGGGGRLFAFDVRDDDAPGFLSEVDLTKQGWWSFSQAFVANHRIYLSHQAFVELHPHSDSLQTNSDEDIVVPWPTGYMRSFLDVVDYSDAADPTVRRPVCLPGVLEGVSHGGALLYTVGFHRTSTNYYEGFEALDASAYDGISVHRVDMLPLPNVWPHPVLVKGGNVFLGRSQMYSSSTNIPPSTVETWTLSKTGDFTRLGSTVLSGPASELVSFPGLLAAQVDWNRVQVFDDSDPALLRPVGEGPANSCVYFNLNHADADRLQSLWLPLDAYGVVEVELFSETK